MKRLLQTFLCVCLVAAVAFGAMSYWGISTLDDIRSRLPRGFSFLQNTLGNAAQIAIDQGNSLVSQFADHIQPSGEGRPLSGSLPEDRLGDSVEYEFSGEMYPYRNMLSEEGKQAYDQIYANAAALYDQFPLRTPIPVDSVAEVMSAVFYDHPELFWLETSYQYTYNSKNQIVAVTMSFNEAADDIDYYRSRYDSAVREVVTQARQFESRVEQEKYVHDYLLDNVTYRLDSPLNQSAYSALVYGESVCAGYARAFQHLLLELGIPCYYCTGYAGDGHAWNIVMLDGEYYNVDVAWDDPLGNESGKRYYNYFNITDEEIFKDHSRSDMSVNLPACEGTKYSYENVFGDQDHGGQSGYYSTVKTLEERGYSAEQAVTSLDEYNAYCLEQLTALGTGTHTFSVLISDKELVDGIFAQLDSQEAMAQYVRPAAMSLGLTGYSASVSLQAESLAEGYWVLTQQIQFSAQS